MRAFRLLDWQRAPEFVEVPIPRPQHGEVLVRVTAAGLCRSDLTMIDAPATRFDYGLPFTLGHETSGYVHAVGPGVGLRPGTPVLVGGGPWCGDCAQCSQRADNYCERRTSGRGFGQDGGLAEFVSVAAHQTVSLTTLHPVDAAPLACAGVTAYHAVRRVLPKLVPGSSAVVIGVGGVGLYAIQLLRALSACEVIAADIDEARLAHARRLGAHHCVLTGANLGEQLRKAAGRPVEVVLDLAGTQQTIDAALDTVGVQGSVALVGAAGGVAQVGWGRTPVGCEVFIPLNGSLAELRQLVALAERTNLQSVIKSFPFAEIPAAYQELRAGKITGRAVVTTDPQPPTDAREPIAGRDRTTS